MRKFASFWQFLPFKWQFSGGSDPRFKYLKKTKPPTGASLHLLYLKDVDVEELADAYHDVLKVLVLENVVTELSEIKTTLEHVYFT